MRSARLLMDGPEQIREAHLAFFRAGAQIATSASYQASFEEVLAEAGPDVLALETVPDIDEAEALMIAVAGLGIPVWLSYSIAAGRTRAGQSLAEAFAVAAGVPEVVAAGVNCSAPARCSRPSLSPGR